ncbi:MAG: enoyl-CoA hydratase [Actinobacteria bacterium]|nr:enoyl-CoA hydratase [Actinomycetota bacterium]
MTIPDEGTVGVEVHGAVAVVSINRPTVRNAFTWSMYQRLEQVCDTIDALERVRVAVVRGVGGDAFSTGTDIREFTTFSSTEDGIRYEQYIAAVLSRLESIRVPTVAAIDGVAAGGGLLVAAACDLRICTEDSALGLPMARTVGNCLSAVNANRVASLVGVARLKDLVFTGRFLDAAEAMRIGLVNEVVPGHRLDSRMAELCAELCKSAPLTMLAAKLALRVEGPNDDGVALCYSSADFREGVSAFLEKREPMWSGQ